VMRVLGHGMRFLAENGAVFAQGSPPMRYFGETAVRGAFSARKTQSWGSWAMTRSSFGQFVLVPNGKAADLGRPPFAWQRTGR
jgi:hypothetical protein